MSLYGALSASVAGLSAQSNKIGVISDNISNANTVGYKDAASAFDTLVTNSGLVSSYSPGGVLAGTTQLVTQQGLIQGTSSATDVAISGSGFFVVNTLSSGLGTTMYTRAGSFTQDSNGNFVNSAGFFMQGWPLDRSGQLPGAPGNPDTNSSTNLSSLQTVNVQQATGNAAATTKVSLSANLQASQIVYPGAAATATMDKNSVNNYAQPGKSIIVPDTVDGMQPGDQFAVKTGTGLSYSYTYGGFTYSRTVNAASSSADYGNSNQPVEASPLTLGSNPFTTGTSSDVVAISAPNSGLADGDVITISGETSSVNGIPASDLNKSFVVSNVTSSGFDITVTTDSSLISGGTGGDTGLSVVTRPFAGNILDASSESTPFLSVTGTSGFTTSALSFTITTQASGTQTFTYTSSTPNAQLGQFNTLDNLADAINTVSGLTARVVGGRLYVASTDANAAVTFTNGDTQGVSGPPVQAGIDWVGELGLSNISAGTDRFNSLDSLASAINASSGLNATVSNDLTDATLSINVQDPLDTISFADRAAASPITGFGSSPFTTAISSNQVTVTAPSQVTFKAGDTVTLDSTGIANYPSPISGSSGSPFTTGTGSTTVTIADTAAGTAFTNGDTIYIDPSSLTGYPSGTVNGIPMTDLSGNFTVSNVVAGASFDITVANAATSGGVSTPGGQFLVSQTVNGIPLTDFNGKFTVQSVSGQAFTIDMAHEATLAPGSPVIGTGLVVTPPTNSGSVLSELGLATSLNGASFTPQSLGPLGPEYDPTDATKNMAGGAITPQYSQNVQIYDSLGTGHNLKVSFIKTATNTWAVEVYATNTSDVSSADANGLLASGTLTFNGDGSLRSVSSGLASGILIPWTDGAEQSTVTFNWGTAGEPAGTAGATQIGETDGMSQFDSSYKINSVNQDGAAVGQLTSVTIDDKGRVIANYNNGQTQALYQIPIAVFSAPDSLNAVTGNAYTQTANSGEPNLEQSGTNGAGSVQSSALESSTVDLSTELTNLIVAQRSYEANAKLITAADQMLQDINNTLQG